MDSTALLRQKRRLTRMGDRGLHRSTVLVHEVNKVTLDLLRPHFSNPDCAEVLAEISRKASNQLSAVNVAQVQQLSPFRYAGGKTWLVPEMRRWLASLQERPTTFVEPFAGGAILGLTVAVENLADKVVLCEIDPDVAAVWRVVFGRSNSDAEWLFQSILDAELTESFVRSIISEEPRSIRARAFRTIIKNRCQRGGILAPGAGLVKAGENGNGLLSRWYPDTLVKRMTLLRSIRKRVEFVQGDAFELIAKYAEDPSAVYLIDPPYTAGGKKAGGRLYLHNSIDHTRLFQDMRAVAGKFLMTYDDATEVLDLAAANGMVIARVPMKNTHHAIIHELLIKKGEGLSVPTDRHH